jgi:hypothetical protein
MRFWKARLSALIVIAISAMLIYYNWQQLWQEGRYYIKLATFGPVGVIGGIFLLFFPAYGGRPESTRQKIIMLLVFVVGLAAGLLNWYLMDPGFFNFIR